MTVRRLFGRYVTRLTTVSAVMLAFALASPVTAQVAGTVAVKTVAQTGKNIKVLKDLPSDQLYPTMRFFAYSLGVECQFCHVEGDDSKDDKKEKKTARDMITMEVAINKENFKANTAVTCYTCHRGAQQPGPVRVVEPTFTGNTAAPASAANLPTADAVFAKYVEALGGEQALRKISSMTITGTRQVTENNGQIDQGTFEEYEKAPNLLAMCMHTSKGQTTATGFDGASAWFQNANGVVFDASGTRLARVKRMADFYEPLDSNQEYTRVTVRRIEKIGDRDAYLLSGTPEGEAQERLYFDTQTGLLIRRVSTLQSQVIAAPTQTDYFDYRTMNGVKYPSTIKIADVPGEPQYSLLQVEKVEFNKVDDSKFTRPVSKPQQPSGGH